VRLTLPGEALLPAARRCSVDVDERRTLAANVASGWAGRLRIGYGLGAGESVAMLVRELVRRTPQLVLHPVKMLSVEVTAALDQGGLLADAVRILQLCSAPRCSLPTTR